MGRTATRVTENEIRKHVILREEEVRKTNPKMRTSLQHVSGNMPTDPSSEVNIKPSEPTKQSFMTMSTSMWMYILLALGAGGLAALVIMR